MTVERFYDINTAVPSQELKDDPYNLGLRFYTTQSGSVVGVQFYFPSIETNFGQHVTLWDNNGNNLLTEALPSSLLTGSGWKEYFFNTPIPISANNNYVIAVDVQAYPFTAHTFDSPITVENIVGLTGVFYDNGNYQNFPSSSFNNASYFRGPIFDNGQSSDAVITIAETITIQDSLALQSDAIIPIQEQLQTKDTLTLRADATIPIAEQLAIAPNLTLKSDATVPIHEQLQVIDGFTLRSDAAIALHEQLQLRDSLLLHSDAVIKAQESVLVSDRLTLKSDASIPIREQLQLIPFLTLRSDAKIAIQEQLQVSDRLALKSDAAIRVIEQLLITDKLTLKSDAKISIVEVIRLIDNLGLTVSLSNYRGKEAKIVVSLSNKNTITVGLSTKNTITVKLI